MKKGFGSNKKLKSPKSTNKKIINTAINHHIKGNLIEAKKLYEFCIEKGILDERLYSNYGLILKAYGKLAKAEEYQFKAIKINSDSADLYLNLGITQQSLGKLKEAEVSLKKAISINPKSETGHYNLANVSRDLGKVNESLNSYLLVLKLNPKSYNIYPSISRLLRETNPIFFDHKSLSLIINILLKYKNVQHNDLFKAFNHIYKDLIIDTFKKIIYNDNNEELISSLVQNQTIVNALERIIFKDIEIELLLTQVRRNLCILIANNHKKKSEILVEFIITLGTQCFLNEYIYYITDEENQEIKKIIKYCQNNNCDPEKLAILSCYLPLYKLIDEIPSIQSFKINNAKFQKLIKLQVLEPQKEYHLSKNIKKCGEIKNQISLRVKSQYEDNPYPRWVSSNVLHDKKLSVSQAINEEIRPNYIQQIKYNQPTKILIAGCGTGHQILYSQKFKNAKITCIDLSLSSLAYAQRKINELCINNVELILMDLLEVHLLNEKFDIIECSGVLHHMEKPFRGLEALVKILNHNGLINIGLYSELARSQIASARSYIKNNEIKADSQSIRNFRQKIILNKVKDLNFLKNYSDFYSLSTCRDLCFHTQEQRFKIPQIQNALNLNQLNFLGFYLPPSIKFKYKNNFPEDNKLTNLNNWAKFEESHPNTFLGMYQLWASKAQT